KNLSAAARKRFHTSSDLLRRTGPMFFHDDCMRLNSPDAASQSVDSLSSSARRTSASLADRLSVQTFLRVVRSSRRRVKKVFEAVRKRCESSRPESRGGAPASSHA